MVTTPIEKLVGTVWALCRRPRLYTPTGSPGEVVAYLAGLLHQMALQSDEKRPEHEHHFAEWLCTRSGRPALELATDAAVVNTVLTMRFPDDPVAALWDEFEGFADEVLGVPRGTYPIRRAGCGYGGATTSDDDSKIGR